jgi:signal transduction histidine kinase/CheY-like chemotaxis protein
VGTGLRKDGTTFDVETRWIPFRYGEYRRILVVIQDATERNRMFRRLLEEQKEESITAVAGGVAHDFNNLLMGITGPLSQLRASLPAGGDVARQVDRIASTADQLSRLTGQLLAIARGVHAEQRPLSIARVVEESRVLLDGLLGSRFRLELEISNDEMHVHGDRVQLGQVLLNLAQNARDAMERGGLLRVSADVVTLEDGFTCDRTGEHPAGDYVRLRVTDDGAGIEEETQRHIFEPYFSTKRGGSGLGLAAVLGIVHRHRGALRLETAPGAGTTVEILLPRCDEPVVDEAASETRDEAPAEAQRVLLVDDNDLVRDVATSLLDWLGCEVVVASSGQEAVEIYQERDRPFDLVILDVSMPGLNGVETNEILQRIDPDVRVVLSSGHAERLVRDESVDVRIAGFLEKPYTLERLREALVSARRSTGATRENA